MPELIITRGLPASGKTTAALEWVSQADAVGERRARVNRDELRHNLFGVYWGLTSGQEDAVTLVQDAAVSRLLRVGWSVVCDDMNLRPEDEVRWRRLAHEVSYWGAYAPVKLTLTRTTWEFLDVPLDELVARDAARGERGERYVGTEVLERLYAKYSGLVRGEAA